ncbi:MAG: DNA methyltransferase [Candidatus Symbiobacter sp.]|nr:DNA methyltransferase [Candidatus Symbiobacter sp.]
MTTLTPTQLKRTIFCRDNLDVLRMMTDESVDLVYLDPPFNSNRTYHAPIGTQAEGASFKDTWSEADLKIEWLGLIADKNPQLYAILNGVYEAGYRKNFAYLAYMAVRLIELKRILNHSGSIYLHCDPTMAAYLKLTMDAIFGEENFRNEIIWCYRKWSVKQKQFSSNHDVILFYSKSKDNLFNPQIAPISKGTEKRWKGKKQISSYTEDGRRLQIATEEETTGGNMPDWWEISVINSQARERVGYPTQKPLALLNRIITASSNEGDTVLDPFCGCATTCVAAEKLGRNWIGIDVSQKAFDLVRIRLQKEFLDQPNLIHRIDEILFRTDLPSRPLAAIDPPRVLKQELYGKQLGNCAGCGYHFPFRNFTVDHIIPRAKGGGDEPANLQLLCGACNSMKGDRPMEYLLKTLAELKIGRESP